MIIDLKEMEYFNYSLGNWTNYKYGATNFNIKFNSDWYYNSKVFSKQTKINDKKDKTSVSFDLYLTELEKKRFYETYIRYEQGKKSEFELVIPVDNFICYDNIDTNNNYIDVEFTNNYIVDRLYKVKVNIFNEITKQNNYYYKNVTDVLNQIDYERLNFDSEISVASVLHDKKNVTINQIINCRYDQDKFKFDRVRRDLYRISLNFKEIV